MFAPLNYNNNRRANDEHSLTQDPYEETNNDWDSQPTTSLQLSNLQVPLRNDSSTYSNHQQGSNNTSKRQTSSFPSDNESSGVAINEHFDVLLSLGNNSTDLGITNSDIDMQSSLWEPFPLFPPPNLNDRKERAESLLAFVELAASNPFLDEEIWEVGEGSDMASRASSTPAHGRDSPGSQVREAPLSQSQARSINQESSASIIGQTFKDHGSAVADESSTTERQVEGLTTRFRGYQQKQWEDNFRELILFKKDRGHCMVPHNFEKNRGLARWVKRQRFQYKRLQEGLKSTLTGPRLEALVDLGFVWDSHTAVWEDHLSELKVFCSINGHCNVPSTFVSNPQLSTWVKSQRRQYKLLVAKKKSTLTPERVAKLNEIGFQWNVEGHSRIQPSNATLYGHNKWNSHT